MQISFVIQTLHFSPFSEYYSMSVCLLQQLLVTVSFCCFVTLSGLSTFSSNTIWTGTFHIILLTFGMDYSDQFFDLSHTGIVYIREQLLTLKALPPLLPQHKLEILKDLRQRYHGSRAGVKQRAKKWRFKPSPFNHQWVCNIASR